MPDHAADLALWRQHFHAFLLPLPHQPEMGTLVEVIDRLDAALGYLQGLAEGTPSDKKLGVAIARLALDYVTQVYHHFGWWDEDDPPVPPPRTMAHAVRLTEGLLADARERRAVRWLGVGGDDEAPEGMGQGEQTARGKEDAGTARKPIPDDEANVLVRKFLEEHPSATARQVAQGVGIALGRVSQMPAWRAELGRRKATRQPRPRKARPLDDKMLQAIGKKDDPAARVEAEEAAWQELVEKARPPERARLHAMTKDQKASLIRAYLESRTQEGEDFGPSRS